MVAELSNHEHYAKFTGTFLQCYVAKNM